MANRVENDDDDDDDDDDGDDDDDDNTSCCARSHPSVRLLRLSSSLFLARQSAGRNSELSMTSSSFSLSIIFISTS